MGWLVRLALVGLQALWASGKGGGRGAASAGGSLGSVSDGGGERIGGGLGGTSWFVWKTISPYSLKDVEVSQKFAYFQAIAYRGHLAGRPGFGFLVAPKGHTESYTDEKNVCAFEKPRVQLQIPPDGNVSGVLADDDGVATVYFLCDRQCCEYRCCELNAGLLLFLGCVLLGVLTCCANCVYQLCVAPTPDSRRHEYRPAELEKSALRRPSSSVALFSAACDLNENCVLVVESRRPLPPPYAVAVQECSCGRQTTLV